MLDIEKAKSLLEKTATLLEDMQIKYWIDSGTLLGAYRDKALIPYDHDIDIRILPNAVSDDKVPDLIRELWKVGYRGILQNYGKRAQLICLTNDRIMLDLKFAFQDENLLWVYCWRSATGEEEPRVHVYPRKFFETMGEIELYGRKYPCPEPVKEYIICHYGENWREFKDKAEKAEETDLSWDYMYSPPCAMSLQELAERRRSIGGKDGRL